LDGVIGAMRIGRVAPAGLLLGATFYYWNDLTNNDATWSATRLGVYRPCTTTTSEGV